MASSRKSKLSSLPIRVEEILRGQIKPGNHLIVALSGGMDSVVLIDLLSKLSAKMQFTLSAVHIDHGISANSNGWAQFSRKLCRSLGIPLKTTKLKLKRGPGVNLESLARDARYQVFSSLRADYVVLAQHLDDQAETLLLQLLRGSGARGLSAMPMVRSQPTGIGNHALPPSPRILRPLLEIPQSEIESYAKEHQLSWITDESNADTSFDRNFLRHEILPILGERFPSYRTTFLRTSRHLSEASSMMDELAESDSERCTLSGKIQIEGLRTLTLPRAKNLLRYTLGEMGAILPSTLKLDEILRQLLSSSPSTKPHLTFGMTEIRCFKGAIHIRPLSAVADTEWQLSWNGEKKLIIPERGGTISFSRRKSAGISLSKLMTEESITIRPRRGGERLCPDRNRPRRSLKNLLQEASLPPWERSILPLLFGGESLVWAPGIGIDCDFQATAGEMGLVVQWNRE